MNSEEQANRPSGIQAFRRALLRGLGLVAPPLLTVLILIWVLTTVQNYVLTPVEATARYFVALAIRDVHRTMPDAQPGDETAMLDNEVFHKTPNGDWIPASVYNLVFENLHDQPLPYSGAAFYQEYVQIRFLRRQITIPALLCIFVLVLYFTGKFVAIGVGRILWTASERQILHRLPVVRNVYSSVKQVTDFLLNDRELEFTRIVAVEYPRKGIWSLGFVTSESLLDIRSVANEPVMTVLIPTSPMPATGFTVNVKKSETVDLNITLDQALQFIVSCGVVVPDHQMTRETANRIASQIADAQQNGVHEPADESPPFVQK
ncbi:DUF502 domain-containing protein [Blastopirellula marina]|uniref:DUF502 domain-containing protein n=1 Tax=Blastopirellula marina TaxID=124 RepID=A0A2S8GAG4_9BACT|nr:DUF502 domain-containing protein [Blastopirellula marina]PQO35383.1 hypothetical protein C5Y98_13540 [Blastopirellula marina]PQO41448.1 hypothetical protein C5Y93_30505 [Blastopirellula marina]PTL44023.1 DUF502 domain-containing protein [Blastopirellula marina]